MGNKDTTASLMLNLLLVLFVNLFSICRFKTMLETHVISPIHMASLPVIGFVLQFCCMNTDRTYSGVNN